jgi:hypothetical protein
LWHHQQLSGQPLRKTVVRMPGPSWMENFLMSKMTPLTTGSSLDGMLCRYLLNKMGLIALDGDNWNNWL